MINRDDNRRKDIYLLHFIDLYYIYLQLMKPAYKGRKPPVESMRPENAKLPPIESKSKF